MALHRPPAALGFQVQGRVKKQHKGDPAWIRNGLSLPVCMLPATSKKPQPDGVCRKGMLRSISRCRPAAHPAVMWQQAAAQPSAPLKQQLWGEVCAFQPAQLSLPPHLLLPKYFQQLCWVQGMRQGSLRQDYLTLQNSSIFKVVFHKDKKQCRYQTRDE